MFEKGIWEMKVGWDLQMVVRRSPRNSEWIDQLTLKEGPLVQDSRKKKVGR